MSTVERLQMRPTGEFLDIQLTPVVFQCVHETKTKQFRTFFRKEFSLNQSTVKTFLFVVLEILRLYSRKQHYSSTMLKPALCFHSVWVSIFSLFAQNV